MAHLHYYQKIINTSMFILNFSFIIFTTYQIQEMMYPNKLIIFLFISPFFTLWPSRQARKKSNVPNAKSS